MATGKIWDVDAVDVNTVAVKSYSYKGDLLSTQNVTLAETLAAPVSGIIIRREGITVIAVHRHIYTLHSGGISSYQWTTNTNPYIYPLGLSHADGKFYFNGQADYNSYISRYSADGISWSTGGALNVVHNATDNLMFGCYLSYDPEYFKSYFPTYRSTTLGTGIESGVTQIIFPVGTGTTLASAIFVYNGVLYAFAEKIFGDMAFCRYTYATGASVLNSVSFDTDFLFGGYFYVTPSGNLRFDGVLYYADTISTFELNDTATAFTLVSSGNPKFMRSYFKRSDVFVPHVTTGGYVHLDYKNASNVLVQTPVGVYTLPSSVFSPSIEDGDFDPFDEFWVEEDDCVESTYAY